VITAKRLGAEQIIVLGRHQGRIELAEEFGASDIVSERGEAAVERVRELTDGVGVDSVLECVGLEQAVATAFEIACPGGAVGRVGVPESETSPVGVAFWKNVAIAGGPAPARAYIDELLPDVLDGKIDLVASSIGSRTSTGCPTTTAR
jgi:threonine dehydrogenase-like Zn-dependent dehydrogenase